jgi:hypothetical protein
MLALEGIYICLWSCVNLYIWLELVETCDCYMECFHLSIYKWWIKFTTCYYDV